MGGQHGEAPIRVIFCVAAVTTPFRFSLRERTQIMADAALGRTARQRAALAPNQDWGDGCCKASTPSYLGEHRI